ncbi:WhiB family transcriptional regulator [Nocardia sp. NPDC050697]|uniref:WhiB family transcriptional regulator n=1 Tax=Nocardia sp. NPDC050697 TaxID=3155158 RepID=UPI00340DA052
MGIDTVQPIDLSSVGTITPDQKRAAARYVVTKATSRAEAAELLAMLGLDQQKPRKTRQRSVWPSDLAPKPKTDRAPTGPGAAVEQAWTDRARCRYQPERWWSTDDVVLAEAKRLCIGCPVRRQCGQKAYDKTLQEGVAAGFSLDDRDEARALAVYLEVPPKLPVRKKRPCEKCGKEFRSQRKDALVCPSCKRDKPEKFAPAPPLAAHLRWLRAERGLSWQEIGLLAEAPIPTLQGVAKHQRVNAALAKRVYAITENVAVSA